MIIQEFRRSPNMAKVGKYLPLIIAVLIGLLFQQLFIFWDKKDTPSKAAMDFAQAYCLLDEHTLMERLCRQSSSSGMVDDYLYRVTQEAAARGFSPRYMKSRIFQMQTHTLEQSDDTAKVRIIGKRRNSINPVYEYVANLFCLTRAYDVNAVLDLVKENGQWKVCGKKFDLM
jgi:hypothetical protein